MDRQALYEAIKSKRSYLCVGLDSDLAKLPSHIRKEKDPIFEFNRRIIDATAEYAVAYKPNIAFYESLGSAGWDSLARTMEYIPEDIFTIADAKRGDIGNTSRLYAKAFFENMNFDSITVAPYMGEDSITPFLEYEGKWVILLAHTSNPGSADFQLMEDRDGNALYENVLRKSSSWATPDQLMFVVGATRADKIAHIRSLVPDHFFLVPGVGAQGGDLEVVSRQGFNAQCGLLVNSSRGIIFADQGKEFASTAARKAGELRDQMSQLLDEFLPDA